jgi:O-antigen ligase
VRRITYALSLLFIFIVPWEDSISTSGWGSLARIMGLALAGCWLATILIEGRFRKPHAFHYLVLLFFLWNFLSVYWSLDASGTIQRVTTYSQIFLFTLVFWEIFQRPGELKGGLQAYVLGACVLVGGTLYTYANGIVAVAYEGRYSAPGVNAVDMALSVTLSLPMALHLFLNHGRGPWNTILRFVNLAYLPLSIYAVLLTGSRTSLLTAIPFFAYIAATPEIKIQRKVLIFVVLLAVLVALLPFIPQTLLARLSTIGSSIAGEDLGGRVVLWREAIGILARHPVLGTGGGTLDPLIGSAAHNTYVSVAAETGFVGFLLFLSILAVAVYQAVRSPEKHAALWLAILATWAIGVLSLSWEFRKTTWLILTLVVVAGSIVMEPQAEEAKVRRESPASLRLEPPESEAKPKAA